MTGVTAIIDDILVFGQTRAEHDQNLRKVLTHAHERGIKLNTDKVKIGVTEVPYFRAVAAYLKVVRRRKSSSANGTRGGRARDGGSPSR